MTTVRFVKFPVPVLTAYHVGQAGWKLPLFLIQAKAPHQIPGLLYASPPAGPALCWVGWQPLVDKIAPISFCDKAYFVS